MPTDVNYRHHGVGLLRATARIVAPRYWPDPADERDCRLWLREVWPDVAAAVGHASPVLAARVETILAGRVLPARDVRRAALAVVRYTLRCGRSTPFGLFAGVSAVSVGKSAAARLGQQHRVVVGVDGRWLHQVVERLEACPELLAQLDVTFNDAAVEHGGRLSLRGPELVSIRSTPAVPMIRAEAASPVRFGALVDKLTAAFPNAGDPSTVLVTLLDNGFLLTSLRAPSTITDPLGFLLDRLRDMAIDGLPVAPLVRDLQQIHDKIAAHNHHPSEHVRTALAAQMRKIAEPVRVPLSVDLRLDAHVQLPHGVAHAMERAASVLARLAREHTGRREWRDYFAAFCERYGTGTLVPLRMLLNPNSGLGWPRGYPDSPEPTGRQVLSERDRLLLSLAAEATARGSQEIELDDATLARLATAGGGGNLIPPHVDLGARIHAISQHALDRGEFTLTVAPGRAAGTLISRFTPIVPDAGLGAVFAELPTTSQAALPAQLSFAPIYPTADYVTRAPRYMQHVLSVGEHDAHAADAAIRIDDLAVTATTRRLHLVSLSRRRVVEPLVVHALAPKQQPSMARLIGELSRALDVGWIGFDWGAADTLPFRPRVRYGRAILSAARWRLTLSDLPADLRADAAGWDRGLGCWRATWRCPARVELRDFDQLLPPDLDVPAHRDILYRHLRRHKEAELVEAPDPDADGWLDGHAHTVVLPLTSRRAPEPAPRVDLLPVLTREHGHPPGSEASAWLYAKLYVADHRINSLLVHELPDLLAELDDRLYWFVRYPQPREGDDSDHLRLRVRTSGDTPGDSAAVLAAITGWADQLRTNGLLSRLAFDTYFPETGRYLAINEAEDVFAADSRFVLAQLTHLPAAEPSPIAVTALSMFDVAAAFLGSRDHAAEWLRVHGSNAPKTASHRADVEQVSRLMRVDQWPEGIVGWPHAAGPRRERAEALGRYRSALPDGADTDSVLHALLHMHHNRALGVDRDREAVCLRLARHAAATWRARRAERA